MHFKVRIKTINIECNIVEFVNNKSIVCDIALFARLIQSFVVSQLKEINPRVVLTTTIGIY